VALASSFLGVGSGLSRFARGFETEPCELRRGYGPLVPHFHVVKLAPGPSKRSRGLTREGFSRSIFLRRWRHIRDFINDSGSHSDTLPVLPLSPWRPILVNDFLARFRRQLL